MEEPRPQDITHSSPIPQLEQEIQIPEIHKTPITKPKTTNTIGKVNEMAEGGGTIENTLADLTKSLQRLAKTRHTVTKRRQ